MINISRLVLILTFCLALDGCTETLPPIKSASVTYWRDSKPQGAARQLTSEETAKLSAWFQDHRWGWHPVIATFAPAAVLSITHSDGSASSANLMKEIVVVGQNQRSLSESESQELHSIVGAKNGG